MSLDIVVIAFNQIDLTRKCLSAIDIFAPQGHRVILVDNGSTDQTPSLRPALEAAGHTYLRIEENGGPYVAANAGLREVKTRYFANICNDVVITPFALQYMLQAISEERPIIGAVEYEHAHYDFYESEARISHSRWFPRLRASVFFSCFVAERALFDKIGFFDEDFRLTFGDTDWEQRFADSGGKYYLAQHAPVYHGQSVTRKRSGIEADVATDVADHHTFLAKWQGREDVLKKHGLEDPQSKKDFLAGVWQMGHK